MPSPPPPPQQQQQQHRILRQVIELQGGRQADAPALQDAVRACFQRDWLPVVERLCSALGDPQRVQRINRLEVDLSGLPVQWWLAPEGGPVDTAALFEAALAPRLSAALLAASEVPTALELLAHALHGGLLPWWADPADRTALARAADDLLAGQASAWRTLLGQPGAGDAALRRLVAGLDDGRLARLLAALLAPAGTAPAGTGAWPAVLDQAWQQALAGSAAAQGLALPALQSAWWREALATALGAAGAAGGVGGVGGVAPVPADWLPGVLGRLNSALGLAEGRLPAALRQALDQPGLDTQPTALAPLWQALAATGGRPVAPVDDPLAAALARLAASTGPAAPWWRRLAAALAGATAGASADKAPPADLAARAALRARLAEALQDRDHNAPALAAALQAVLDRLAPAPGLPAPASADALAQALRAAAARRAADPDAINPAASGLQPAAVDAVYVGNAGLVLLGPFLQRFFDRQGLLDQGRWRDDAAPWRAARLLQCVAGGEVDAPDLLLPLNKLLCGLPLDAVPERMVPLADEERAECEALLRAVIAQAPILRDMSTPGFRGSFLLRTGQLSARDGHWLLRVERQAWDLVIDRFPWQTGLLRLPWMPALLQVQW